jgi:hypothetical protein
LPHPLCQRDDDRPRAPNNIMENDSSNPAVACANVALAAALDNGSHFLGAS